jgi:hypothetical protein
MRGRHSAAALVLAMTLAATPAQACRFTRPLDPGFVRLARTVVVGRIVAYRLDARPFALFTLVVDEVLRGRPARRLLVRWDRSSIAHPRVLPPGRYLIGLHNPRAGQPPRGAYTVLQGPCTPAFILEAGSPRAEAARRALAGR